MSKQLTLQELIAKKKLALEAKKSLDQTTRPIQRWWPEKDSTTTIRIVNAPGRLLVNSNVEEDPFYERYKHKNIPGTKYGGLCLKRNGLHDSCPACDLGWQMVNASETEEEKKTAKQLLSNTTYFSLVLVRGEEVHGLRWWEYNYDMYNRLFSQFCGKHYFNFTDPENGFDLEVTRKLGKKVYNGKPVQDTDFAFVPERCPVIADAKGNFDKEAFDKLLSSAPTWQESQYILSIEDMEKAINTHLHGGTETEVSGGSEESFAGEDGKTYSAADDAFAEFLRK